jgi:hypothetical protein
VTGDSVVKTLLILFVIAISPAIIGLAFFVGWLWLGVIWGG